MSKAGNMIGRYRPIRLTLGNSDVFDKKNDDRAWNLWGNGGCQFVVDDRGTHVLETCQGGSVNARKTEKSCQWLTSRNSAKNAKFRCLAVVSIDKPADHGEQQNDKACPESGDEEPKFRPVGVSSGGEITGGPNGVQEEQGREPHRSIEVGSAKVLENVDEDFVCGRTGIEASNACLVECIRLRPLLREKEATASAHP